MFPFIVFKEALPIKALNDSGCLLGDSDLFDAQLEEDSEHQLEGEEEESLDAIRSAVKKKAKHKVSTDLCLDCLKSPLDLNLLLIVIFHYVTIASSVRLQWRRGTREQVTTQGEIIYYSDTISLILLIECNKTNLAFPEQIVFRRGKQQKPARRQSSNFTVRVRDLCEVSLKLRQLCAKRLGSLSASTCTLKVSFYLD